MKWVIIAGTTFYLLTVGYHIIHHKLEHPSAGCPNAHVGPPYDKCQVYDESKRLKTK